MIELYRGRAEVNRAGSRGIVAALALALAALAWAASGCGVVARGKADALAERGDYFGAALWYAEARRRGAPEVKVRPRLEELGKKITRPRLCDEIKRAGEKAAAVITGEASKGSWVRGVGDPSEVKSILVTMEGWLCI